MKTCTKCKENKPVSEFYKDSRRKDGLQSGCKECHLKVTRHWFKRNRFQKLTSNRKWYASNKEKCRNDTLKKKYNLTLGAYESMLSRQDDRCAICRTEIPGGRHGIFNIDHNHQTGEVRGLLCSKCNVGLGCFKDDLLVLESAIDYLKGTK